MLELPVRPQGAELIRTVGLTRHFRLGGFLSRRFLHAVDDIDLSIHEDEIVALVGESGSGKSTIARLIAMVYKPTAGEIYHRGRPLATVRSRREVLEYRGHVPMVFQDPYGSLSPVYRVSHGIMRALKLHRADLSRRGREEEAQRLLEAVGLVPAVDVDRILSVGNTAGEGAKMALLSFRERQVAFELPEKIEYVELSGRSDFNDSFVSVLRFPDLEAVA